MTQTKKTMLAIASFLLTVVGVVEGMALIWFIVIPLIGSVLQGFFNFLVFPFS